MLNQISSSEEPTGLLKPIEINYDKYPLEFASRMQSIATQLQSPSLFAVAGQIFIDGIVCESPHDFELVVDDEPVYHFNNGGFLSRALMVSETQGRRHHTIRTMGMQTEIREFPIDIQKGKLNYFNIFLRTARDKLSTLVGQVQDEEGKPVSDSQIRLSIPLGRGETFGPHNYFEFLTTTDTKGEYSIPGIVIHPYLIIASKNGFSNAYTRITANVSQPPKLVLKYHNRKVTVDTIYQPDGSTNFTNNNIIKQRYELDTTSNATANISKMTGRSIVFDPSQNSDSPTDIVLRHDTILNFVHSFYFEKTGHYCLKDVDFDSVTEADATMIKGNPSPCEVGYVYVVRTTEKGCYAKFIVRSIEGIATNKN